jgi:hypothetical protein
MCESDSRPSNWRCQAATRSGPRTGSLAPSLALCGWTRLPRPGAAGSASARLSAWRRRGRASGRGPKAIPALRVPAVGRIKSHHCRRRRQERTPTTQGPLGGRTRLGRALGATGSGLRGTARPRGFGTHCLLRSVAFYDSLPLECAPARSGAASAIHADRVTAGLPPARFGPAEADAGASHGGSTRNIPFTTAAARPAPDDAPATPESSRQRFGRQDSRSSSRSVAGAVRGSVDDSPPEKTSRTTSAHSKRAGQGPRWATIGTSAAAVMRKHGAALGKARRRETPRFPAMASLTEEHASQDWLRWRGDRRHRATTHQRADLDGRGGHESCSLVPGCSIRGRHDARVRVAWVARFMLELHPGQLP